MYKKCNRKVKVERMRAGEREKITELRRLKEGQKCRVRIRNFLKGN